MLDDDDFLDDLDRKTPVQRYAVPAIGIMLFAGAAAAGFVIARSSHTPAPRPHVEPHITQVQLPPPPPPPPPPKQQPPEPKKLQEASRIPTPTSHPVHIPKAAPPAPANRTQTSVVGNGNSGLGVGNGGGNDCLGQNCGNGDGAGGGGDLEGYYYGQLKTQITEALKRDDKLRFAHYRMTLAFALDSAGHLAHVDISSFSGDEDARDEVNRVIHTISTGDAPQSLDGKQFSVRITEHAPG
jgi:protein TonB